MLHGLHATQPRCFVSPLDKDAPLSAQRDDLQTRRSRLNEAGVGPPRKRDGSSQGAIR